jgi:hypothetical protein
MDEGKVAKPEQYSSPSPLPAAPRLMLLFGMLLGGVAGINFVQFLWKMFGWTVGRYSIALPVGAVLGACGGALAGRVSDPGVLVLFAGLFAGWATGSTAGKQAWGDVGALAGQFIGAAAGVLVWLAWFLVHRAKQRGEEQEHDKAS